MTSCTARLKTVEGFHEGGDTGETLITVHTRRTKLLSCLSLYPAEDEYVLMPGSQVRMKGYAVLGDVTIIHCWEVEDGEEQLVAPLKEVVSAESRSSHAGVGGKPLLCLRMSMRPSPGWTKFSIKHTNY